MESAEFVERLLAPPNRWALLKEFVAYWHAPLQTGQGYSSTELNSTEQRLGTPLPEALREWYGLAGRRADLVAAQDRLRTPQALSLDLERLTFHVENQGCCQWFIRKGDLSLPDPPVYLDRMDNLPDRIVPAASTVSEFALHMVLQETVICGPGPKVFGTNISTATTTSLVSNLVDLGLPHWHWPAYPRALLASPGPMDLLVEITGPTDNCQIFVAGRTRSALSGFLRQFPDDWDRVVK